jgi:hypothetical protein
MCYDVMEIFIIRKNICPICACVKKWKPFLAGKKGVLRLIFFLNTKSIHNCTKICPLVE